MTELAKRYGGSLYELAAEENLTDELLQQLRTAVNSIEAEPQYLRLLSTPSVPKRSAAPCWTRRSREPIPTSSTSSSCCAGRICWVSYRAVCARIRTATMLITISLRSRQYRPLR